MHITNIYYVLHIDHLYTVTVMAVQCRYMLYLVYRVVVHLVYGSIASLCGCQECEAKLNCLESDADTQRLLLHCLRCRGRQSSSS